MLLILRFFNPYFEFRIPKLKNLIALVFFMLCIGFSDGGLWAMPPVQRTVLPNRLVLLVCEEHSLPFVTFQLLIDSGSRRDPHGEEGLSIPDGQRSSSGNFEAQG